MKLLAYLIFVVGAMCVAFFLTTKLLRKQKTVRNLLYTLIIFGGIFLSGFGVFATINSSYSQDRQCVNNNQHYNLPNLTSAQDYFRVGNTIYENKDCTTAIMLYTKAIALQPNYPEAYNNRAYTYMRMQEYSHALSDLNEAIKLKPDYVNALMNRGDIYNYYYLIDKQKAIQDYDKVISLGAAGQKSVCGHRILAKNNGWHLSTFFDVFLMKNQPGC